MSEQNLEVVARGIGAFNARDVERFAGLATEDFVWAPALPGTLDGALYVGRSGVERYFAETAETWQQLTVDCEELRDLGGGGVLMLGRAVGRGVDSGATVEMPLAFLAEFRGERIAKVQTFRSHDDALAAAREQGARNSA